MEIELGSVVRSKSGRDKGLYFMVTGFSDSCVLICDGKERPLEKPKKKNPRHIQCTGTKLHSQLVETNSELRKALKPFNDNSACKSTGGR